MLWFGYLLAVWLGALASLYRLRPHVYCCPSCGEPAPLAADGVTLGEAVRGGIEEPVLRGVVGLYVWYRFGRNLLVWFFDGLAKPAMACPCCHAWFVDVWDEDSD